MDVLRLCGWGHIKAVACPVNSPDVNDILRDSSWRNLYCSINIAVTQTVHLIAQTSYLANATIFQSIFAVKFKVKMSF